MKKRYFFLLAIIGIIIFLVYTGGCEFSTASISDVKICKSINQNQCNSDNPIITGNPSEIFVSCKLKYAPEATDINFKWFYFGQTKFEIGDVTLNSGSDGSALDMQTSFSRPNNGWPKGNYEVVIQIMVDGKDAVVKQFQIQ